MKLTDILFRIFIIGLIWNGIFQIYRIDSIDSIWLDGFASLLACGLLFWNKEFNKWFLNIKE